MKKGNDFTGVRLNTTLLNKDIAVGNWDGVLFGCVFYFGVLLIFRVANFTTKFGIPHMVDGNLA